MPGTNADGVISDGCLNLSMAGSSLESVRIRFGSGSSHASVATSPTNLWTDVCSFETMVSATAIDE